MINRQACERVAQSTLDQQLIEAELALENGG
jgi:hypothetical protein